MSRFGFGFGFGSQSLQFAPVFGETSFVTTWNTENLGGTGSATKVILLPMAAGVEVDWGDGTVNNLNTHTYATGGIKTITIADTVTGFRFNNGGDKLKLTEVNSVGNLVVDNANMFHGCENMIWTASGSPSITTSSMRSMFQNCFLFDGNISNWDISSVTTMFNTFRDCDVFNQDIGGWDTSSITSFSSTFNGADLFNQDLSGWDFSQVTTASNMLALTAFDQTNYDLLLPAIDAQSVQNNVAFHAGGAKYGAGAPATARANLIADHTWTITDGGPA